MRHYKSEHSCRVCRAPITAGPMLVYENMPSAAQNFPTAANMDDDKGSRLAVFQCADCELVQLDGPPVPYYREVIRATGFSTEMGEFRRSQLKAWVQKYNLFGKQILEVGCGRGEYLSLLKEAGLKPHGIEFGMQSVLAGRKQGHSISKGFLRLPQQRLNQGPFDAFASFNFMEHWPQPVATLQSIRNNLVEGGLGIVEVPNFDMIVKKGLYSEFISDHLCYFTSATLTHTLHSAGFVVLECKSIWHDYILSAVVKKRQPIDFRELNIKQAAIKKSLHDFLDGYLQKSVAVWGAGHQALATIALAEIGNRIKYVIDSAPFKQGKLTPATHVPIVAPGTLKIDPVTAIIVMAAGYSDEVCKSIRQQLRLDLPVVVLRDGGVEACR